MFSADAWFGQLSLNQHVASSQILKYLSHLFLLNPHIATQKLIHANLQITHECIQRIGALINVIEGHCYVQQIQIIGE